jgi:hypothetical protein
LGRPLSSPTAHWFLLVGRGRQYVMTSIARNGMRSTGGPMTDRGHTTKVRGYAREHKRSC